MKTSAVQLMRGVVLPSAATLVLHLGVLWLLSENWDLDQSRRYVTPQAISARLVKLEAKQPEPAPKVNKPHSKPQAEQPLPKPKQAAASKPKPKPKPTEPPKPEPDPTQQRLERQRRARALQEEQLARMMAEEDAYVQAQSQQELAMSHIGAIQQTVAAMWSRPPSARRNMQVSLLISLIPTGEVVSVRILESSGNSAFDRSAVNAVNKAARFPELAELPPRVFEQYFRELRLVFRPEDLRL